MVLVSTLPEVSTLPGYTARGLILMGMCLDALRFRGGGPWVEVLLRCLYNRDNAVIST